MYERRAKVFFAISGNLLSAAPDTPYAAEAFSRCRLTVQVSTKLNRGHLVTGRQALILPCLGRAERDLRAGGEQFATVEDTMGIINPSRGVEAPASKDLLSEVEIIVRLARATFGERSPFDWNALLDNDRVRDRIERVVPGFEDFNARIRRGPFYLPNGARERVFHTPSGRASFSVCSVTEPNLGPRELLMTTVRSHDQFNTTVYGLNDRYRGIYHGRRVVFVHPDDLKELELEAGQWLDLTSHFDGETRVARRFMAVAYPIARRSAATYFPEANALVPVRSVAARSNQPAQKCVRITLRPSETVGAAAPAGPRNGG
jgi:anaerobic selenocysteine-containing dehydrogenase